jgi:hypothetical protein
VYNAIKTIIENYAGGGTSGGGIQHATASGTDTYTASITGVTSYADGDSYLIRFTNGNTTGATLNINGLGAVDLYRNNDGVVIGGDIEAGSEMLVVYNSSVPSFQCIGTSPNTILAYVTNADSVSITKGMPVYAFGGTGDRMTVKRAYNTTDSTSAQTVGLVMSTSIAAGQKGFIMLQGLLDGLSTLPTSTWADGDAVYLGATAGTISKVKPYAPNHLVYLGFVTTASPGAAGRMYVRVQNGYELDELHNVQAQSPSNNDTIYYDSSVSQWKTASLATILGFTPVAANSAITGATKTKITYDSKGLVTSGADATTADITDSTNKRYVTDAQLVVIGNTSGTNTGDQTLSGLGGVATSRTISTTTPLTGGGDLSANRTLAINQATTSADGYLSSTDWTTFNSKMTGFMQYRKASRWYTNGIFNVQGSSFTNVANTIRYVPFYIDQDITVTRMGINVVTAGAASSTCRLGIYTNDATTCQPSTRLVDTGTIDLVATGPKTVTGLSVALTKGLYWMAYFGNSASGSITAVGANFVFDVKGQATIASIGFVGFNQSLTYTTLPASAGTITEVNGTTTVGIFYYY